MIRSKLAAPTSPRGARRRLRWLLLAGLALPLAGTTTSAPDLPWPPAAESPIRPGESHAWSFEMAAGDFLGVVVEQDGIDVVVELFEGGTKILDADSPDEWWWQEETAWIAEHPGRYRLVVHPWDDHAAPGRYSIRVDGPRPARPEDAPREAAAREMRAAVALYDKRGREQERLDHLESAFRLWRELGERRREAEVLHQMGMTAKELGRMEDAGAHLHRALDLWDQLGLIDRRVWTLLMTGPIDQALLHEEDARDHMEEALKTARRLNDNAVLVQALYEFGHFLEKEPRDAVPYLEEALKRARDMDDRRMEMRSVYQLGYSYDDLAEKQDAMRCYDKALDLSRELNDTGQEANTLNGLGVLYASLGQTEKAIDLYQQSLKLSQRRKDAVKEAAALNNLALLYERLDPAQARSLYGRALALARETHNLDAQAAALVNLAYLELRWGDPSKALELSGQALDLAVKGSESSIRQARGMIFRELGDLESSRRELEAALDLSRRRQDRVRESLVALELARTARGSGDLRGALALLESGIEVVESLRAKVAQEDLRATFLASRQGIYGLYIDTLMALDLAKPDHGHDAAALRASEQARARSLLDILAEAGADVHEGADPGLLARKRRLSAEIEAVETRRLEQLEKGSDLREADERLEALLDQKHKVEADLRVSSPRYAALTQPEPLSLARIQSEVLDGQALLLEYALGEEQSFLWAVTPDGIRSFRLPPRADIEAAARRYYEALSAHPETPAGKAAQARLQPAADELSRILLRPVEELLSGQPLLVVSDGALQYVPFASLPAPSSLDRPKRVLLIDRHEVVSLPSASVLAVLRRERSSRPKPSKELAVLANPVFNSKLPPLRFSEKEANAIAELVAAGKKYVALKHEASRATATSGMLAQYRMVHFGTHGLIDSRHPELSSLVLSLVDAKGRRQNGFLRLHDIYNLKLNADLVVLSACRTALGQEIRGEGLVGLTRGFMYAGAARVMSSLWSVDDRATSELMKRFYGHMLSDGASPAAALRQAQLEMAGHPRWKSPYYWADFSLQGEWR